jgi:hypothetical protein
LWKLHCRNIMWMCYSPINITDIWDLSFPLQRISKLCYSWIWYTQIWYIMRNISFKSAATTFWAESGGSKILWNSSTIYQTTMHNLSLAVLWNIRVVLLFSCKGIGLEQRWQTMGTDAKFDTSSEVTRYQQLPVL